MYNTTNITNANSVYDMFVAVNQLSTGLFATFILFVLFLVILIVFKGRYDMTQVLLGDSFIISIIAIMFFWLGMVHWGVIVIPMVLFFSMLIKEIFWGN